MSEEKGKYEVATQDKNFAIFNAVKNSLYPGAKDESVVMALDYCRAAGLDPMTKPVHLVPMNVKDGKTGKYEWRDVVMPGIELYRTKASRTGEHAGTTEPEFGPTVAGEFAGKDKNGKELPPAKVKYPEWCRVSVRRVVSGQIVEFTAKEFWLENYATSGRDSEIPNSMWLKRPFGQLGKCAEAQALRKGFPEIGAQPTSDEMYGKTIDSEAIDNAPAGMKPTVKPPTALSNVKTLAGCVAEVDAIESVDLLSKWYTDNVKDCQKILTSAEQSEFVKFIKTKKESISPTTILCPERGESLPIDYCDEECTKKEGCPSHG